MTSTPAPDYERERRLIEQLELRIATADSDEKFVSITQKFLPALILKLATENERNRNLTIKVCQHVSQRVKLNQSIQLPIPGLLKNFRETPNAFVRRFSLLFLQQAFGRVDPSKSVDLLPEVLQFSVPQSSDPDLTSRKMWSIAFDFLLDTLSSWKAPERGSQADLDLRTRLALTHAQCDMLASEFCHFLLYDPNLSVPGRMADEDFSPIFAKQFRQRSQVAPRVCDFLFSAIFTDQQRLIPATIMAVDPNSTVSNISDTMFKQCTFDLESSLSVEALFELYQSSRPKLQTKALSLLSRSRASTAQSRRIFSMIEMQLNSQDTSLEASKLRSALFSYLTWAVHVSNSIEQISRQTQGLLKEYIESQGWPSMRDRTSAEAELRSKAYESIGLLSGKHSRPNPDFDLIVWLFTSLRCDTTSDIRSSIEEALARVMNFPPVQDKEFAEKVRKFLLWNATAEVGAEDPVYYFTTVNSTKYVATRFANKCLPFQDPLARLIDIVAIASGERRELSEEGTRGLDPYWHESNQKLTNSSGQDTLVRLPSLESIVKTLLDSQLQENKRIASLPSFLAAAVPFCRNILVTEALSDTKESIDDFTDWKSRIDTVIETNVQARIRLKQHLREVDQAIFGQLLQRSVHGLSVGSGECADIAVELLGFASNKTLSSMESSLLSYARAGLVQTLVQTRAARCFGIIASLNPASQSLLEQELDLCKNWASAVGSEAVEIRGHLLAASFTLSRLSLRGNDETSSSAANALAKLLLEVILTTHDLSLMNAALQCLSQVALCLNPSVQIELEPEKLIDKLIFESKKENERAVIALGRILGFRATKWEKTQISDVTDRIFKLHEIKKAEFHFALGESLAVAVAGFKSTSLLVEFDVAADIPEWGYHEDLLLDIFDRTIESCKNTKPSLKKAAAIWLLSLIQYCGGCPPIQATAERLSGCFCSVAE